MGRDSQRTWLYCTHNSSSRRKRPPWDLPQRMSVLELAVVDLGANNMLSTAGTRSVVCCRRRQVGEEKPGCQRGRSRAPPRSAPRLRPTTSLSLVTLGHRERERGSGGREGDPGRGRRR
eukprot:719974-Rhodomonas_salina.3